MMDGFLNSFFGFRKPQRPESFEYDGGFEDSEMPDSNFDRDNITTFHFDEPLQLFRHFEEIFKNLGLADFPPPGSLEGFSGDGYAEENVPSRHPRDNMLKEPENKSPCPEHKLPFGQFWHSTESNGHPSPRQDCDLDEQVGKEGIQSLIRKEESPHNESNVFSRSSSTVIRNYNGKIEKKTTLRDSSGKEEKTITRKIGNKEYTKIEKKNENGEIQTTENLVNVDEASLPEFNNMWTSPGNQQQGVLMVPENRQDPIYQRIFKNIFGM